MAKYKISEEGLGPHIAKSQFPLILQGKRDWEILELSKLEFPVNNSVNNLFYQIQKDHLKKNQE